MNSVWSALENIRITLRACSPFPKPRVWDAGSIEDLGEDNGLGAQSVNSMSKQELQEEARASGMPAGEAAFRTHVVDVPVWSELILAVGLWRPFMCAVDLIWQQLVASCLQAGVRKSCVLLYQKHGVLGKARLASQPRDLPGSLNLFTERKFHSSTGQAVSLPSLPAPYCENGRAS